MDKIEVIKLKMRMSDPQGKLIPKGVVETLSVEIADQIATFHFLDQKTTRRFAELAMALEKQRGADDTRFIQRVGKAATRYNGKTKEEIRDLLLEQFKQLGINAKNVRDRKGQN